MDELIIIWVSTETTDEGSVYPTTLVVRYEEVKDGAIDAVFKAVDKIDGLEGGVMIEK